MSRSRQLFLSQGLGQWEGIVDRERRAFVGGQPAGSIRTVGAVAGGIGGAIGGVGQVVIGIIAPVEPVLVVIAEEPGGRPLAAIAFAHPADVAITVVAVEQGEPFAGGAARPHLDFYAIYSSGTKLSPNIKNVAPTVGHATLQWEVL